MEHILKLNQITFKYTQRIFKCTVAECLLVWSQESKFY